MKLIAVSAVAALSLLGPGGAGAATAGVASPSDAVSYTWVGSSHHTGGDNHSWTDPKNWLPQGVPSDGDSASVSPTSGECSATVRGMPDGLVLADFSLSAGTKCFVLVKGGSLTVTDTLDWQSGRIAADLTLPATAAARLSGDPGARSFTGSLHVAGALVLQSATITQAGADPLVLEPGAFFDAGGTINGSLINAGGTILVGDVSVDFVVTGNFLQHNDGTLQLEVPFDGPSFFVGGSSTVHGTAVFDTRYNPDIGQENLLMSSAGPWTWQPSCHTTTGEGSDTDHWKVKQGTYNGGGFMKVKWHDGVAQPC